MSVTVALYSDLHKEMYKDHNHQFKWFFKSQSGAVSADGVDVCVLAGDILDGKASLEFLKALCDFFPEVIHVAGNHEYYGAYFEDCLDRLRRLSSERKNYHVLERETITIKDQRFVGCTLWYEGDVTMGALMNDFSMIRARHMTFRTLIEQYAKESVKWLNDTVTHSDVVVTHMLPTYACVSERWRGHRLNCFYVNSCDRIIATKNPKAWLHGHSHDSIDTQYAATRFLRNPRGYPFELNPDWNPNPRLTF